MSKEIFSKAIARAIVESSPDGATLPPRDTLVGKLRRYQILLPKRDGNGFPFSGGIKRKLIRSLATIFGMVTVENCHSEWFFVHGEPMKDRSYRVVCDVPDTLENLAIFVKLKKELSIKFDQEEIWLTSFPIEKVL